MDTPAGIYGMRFVRKIIILIVGMALLSACTVTGYDDFDPPRRTPVYYKTKSGDTVQTIAKRFNVSPDSVMLLNDIDSPDKIPPGSKLMVGYRAKKSSPAGNDTPKIVTASLRTTKPSPSPDENIQPRQNSGNLGWPVLTGRVVSTFGPRGDTFHDGIDIACPVGTPVYASHAGRIVYADDGLGGYGKLVVLRHRSGFTTVYAHNSKLHISVGDEVKKGDHLADSGATGHVTGPHLHYEVRLKNTDDRFVAVDPLPILLHEESKTPNYRINDNLTPLLAKLTK